MPRIDTDVLIRKNVKKKNLKHNNILAQAIKQSLLRIYKKKKKRKNFRTSNRTEATVNVYYYNKAVMIMRKRV